MSRTIIVPTQVALFDKKTRTPMLDGGVPVTISLRRMAYDQWFIDNRWQLPSSNVAKFVRVIEAMDSSEHHEKVQLRDEDWELLCEIVKNPQVSPQTGLPNAAPPLLQLQLQPLINAVLNATLDGKSA